MPRARACMPKIHHFNTACYFIVCIASDMSLAAKPTWTSRARVDEFAQMRNAAENLRVLAEWYVTLRYAN